MKQKEYVKKGLIQCRVDNQDLQEIVTKAHIYTKGNVAAYIRLACLNYRPLKKVKVEK